VSTNTAGDPFTDPDELFDVYDGAGRATGTVRRRADVHRDGDWHRSFHCLVTSERDGAARLIFQRRGAEKDTWPDKLDVTVGGHFRAGEGLEDVVREVEEEIGHSVTLAHLTYLGRHVYVGDQMPGTLDRELQDVYLWRSPLPLEAYRPQPVEVAALEAIGIADLLDLFAGALDHADALVLRPDGGVAAGSVTRDDFIPMLDRYYFRVATVVDWALRGYPYLVV
jgi:isopentenyldiphosphate isomerase